MKFPLLEDKILIEAILSNGNQKKAAASLDISYTNFNAAVNERELGWEIFEQSLARGQYPPLNPLKPYLPSGLKLCATCLKMKPLAKFKQKQAEGRWASDCYKCQYAKHGVAMRSESAQRYYELQNEIYEHYGNQCSNCGENVREMLTIEHINGRDSGKHLGLSGWSLLRTIKREGFPEDITLLCWNCNCFKGRVGELPDYALYWSKVDPNGPGLHAPKRPGDAGFDLESAEDVILQPVETRDISTNVRVQLPYHTWGEIRARSSIARRGLQVDAGVIDSLYNGELYVLMRNVSLVPVNIAQGERIAQLVLHRRVSAIPQEVDDVATDHRRGTDGFGSTGK